MPNHTDNRVIISHDDIQMIDMIYNSYQEEDGDNFELCNMFVPEPRDDAGEPTSGWYEWRLDNWGTKWDVYNVTMTRMDDNTLVMSFDTAWSPPIPVFDKMVDMGYEVNARYLDEGWMYIGEYTDGNDWSTDDVEGVCQSYPDLDEEFGIMDVLIEEERQEYA